MLAVKVTIKTDRLRGHKYKEALSNTIAYGADIIEKRSKQIVPVRTGFLRDSIRKIVKKFKAIIGPTAIYGGWVEYGTWKMNAQPYMRPALDEAKIKIRNYLKKAIKRINK